MKRELWPNIKVGSFVIYADEYEGVHRAKVIETDIKIYSERAAERWSYPYGLTQETGAVRIQYNTKELIENLQNLISYTAWKLGKLRKAWNDWQDYKASAEALRETFLAKVLELKEV